MLGTLTAASYSPISSLTVARTSIHHHQLETKDEEIMKLESELSNAKLALAKRDADAAALQDEADRLADEITLMAGASAQAQKDLEDARARITQLDSELDKV